jgi:hypothetical protein
LVKKSSGDDLIGDIRGVYTTNRVDFLGISDDAEATYVAESINANVNITNVKRYEGLKRNEIEDGKMSPGSLK